MASERSKGFKFSSNFWVINNNLRVRSTVPLVASFNLQINRKLYGLAGLLLSKQSTIVSILLVVRCVDVGSVDERTEFFYKTKLTGPRTFLVQVHHLMLAVS